MSSQMGCVKLSVPVHEKQCLCKCLDWVFMGSWHRNSSLKHLISVAAADCLMILVHISHVWVVFSLDDLWFSFGCVFFGVVEDLVNPESSSIRLRCNLVLMRYFRTSSHKGCEDGFVASCYLGDGANHWNTFSLLFKFCVLVALFTV